MCGWIISHSPQAKPSALRCKALLSQLELAVLGVASDEWQEKTEESVNSLAKSGWCAAVVDEFFIPNSVCDLFAR
jgi:hypothetical protein